MKASDCRCTSCGKQAVAFWPVMDIDIPSRPYCRKCLDKQKIAMIQALFGTTEKEAKAMVHIDNFVKDEGLRYKDNTKP